jgi:hypothetical protein
LSGKLSILVGLGLGFGLVVCSPLQAGSVYMKNGYIIHGPVVERNDEAVVLGWDNGKVTIHRRFIESVVLDPGEEQKIKELAAVLAEEVRSGPEGVDEGEASKEIEELPTDLEVMVEKVAPGLRPSRAGGELLFPPLDGQAAGQPGGDNRPETGGEASPTGDTPPEASRVEGLLAERVVAATKGVSLRPPKGWSVKETQELFQVVGPAAGDGLRPSLNVLSLSRAALSWEECIALFKAEQGGALKDFELLAEGPRKLGAGQEGYEIVGRGAYEGRSMVLRQVLVPQGSQLWLVSGFSLSGPGDDSFVLVDEVLKSLEFKKAQ